jgi:predicted NBD/HSP70 family sugar kinase
MVVVNMGTGIGVGIVSGGKILRGAHNRAGEWGHSLLVLDGRECACGRRGCVEAYLGEPGIRETLREVAPDHPLASPGVTEFSDALAAALALNPDDAALAEALDATARYLGYALADLVAVVDPELIVLTGVIAWSIGETLLPAVTRYLAERAPAGAVEELSVEISTVRGNAVAIGMGTLAVETFVGLGGTPLT